MAATIRCRNLVKTYPGKPPVEAVRGLNLDVDRGDCFGLLGSNGAGKTTTLEIAEGLLEPTSGEVEVLGMRWDRDEAALRRRIGVSLQETRLADKLTVRETLTLFRTFYLTSGGDKLALSFAAATCGELAISWRFLAMAAAHFAAFLAHEAEVEHSLLHVDARHLDSDAVAEPEAPAGALPFQRMAGLIELIEIVDQRRDVHQPLRRELLDLREETIIRHAGDHRVVLFAQLAAEEQEDF
jgi:ABC-type Fe3+/spermidine/putrescine transport system ATPase subunit